VRHGHLPEREVITGIGAVPVKVPRVRDRGDDAEKVRFKSTILPPYLRKAKSVEDLLPWLYLKGISTGDFHEALAALLGPNAAGLSSTTISRLKADWWDECDRWQRRDLGMRRFVYIWADGVCFRPRMAEEKQCVLVLIAAPSRDIALQCTDRQWTATAKAPRVGANCCLICSDVRCPMPLILPSGMALWGSGMRCARSLVPRKNNVAGSTKSAMCSTQSSIAQSAPILVAIDIAKARHEVLIAIPDKKRRRRLTVLNQLGDFNGKHPA